MQAKLWWLWSGATVVLGGWLAMPLVTDGGDKSLYLQGAMSAGHHQIELACDACHTRPFGGGEVLQGACVKCHGAELEVAEDAHPRSKFTDPRNASRVAKLDARYCVTCHVEHQPAITGPMGVTQPRDFCVKCHSDVGDDRPSHRDLAFTTCADAGCHNFHDKRALYEDFLDEHLDEPDVRSGARLPVLSPIPSHGEPLQTRDSDMPRLRSVSGDVLQEWSDSSHARGGVNCRDCHAVSDPEAGATRWTDHPGYQVCSDCHKDEGGEFLAGKHGMRLAQGLTPMTPAQARLPMKPDAADRTLDCNACHGAHRFSRVTAAVESCLGCHDDRHSRAYKQSPHYALWRKEQAGEGAPGSGVSCAGCHLPRTAHRTGGVDRVTVQHNQNDNLRPNEKMVRGVCLKCHGLRYTLDALADRDLIERNFSSPPAVHVRSLDWARQRLRQAQAKTP